jgi:putative hydrolase of the HAD superfamily
MIEAVFWDFGGVITSSPFEAFNRYESANDLPKDIIRTINSTNPDTNAWAQLENSRINVDEFDRKFAQESEDHGYRIPGSDVLTLLSGELRPEMVNALKIIKSRLKIGCITNNMRSGEGPSMARDTKHAALMHEVLSTFDVVIESSKLGIRKPDPRIYVIACKEVGVKPENAVFLDDLGINLKPARAMGMHTIKVMTPPQALDELETLLKFPLR